MKSFAKGAPAFPPPPYTWLMMMLPARHCAGAGGAVVKPVADVYVAPSGSPAEPSAAVVTRTA